jgi:hypothetical protein
MALDALERGRYRTMLAWLAMMLLCQEDAAVMIAPLGVWIALSAVLRTNFVNQVAEFVRIRGRAVRPSPKSNDFSYATFGLGAGLALFGVVYTIAVIKVILPWFRGGADVHFAQYFADLGETSAEITLNVLAHPGLVLGKLFSVNSAIFALALLAPLGFLPLLSPLRLAVAAPLFGVLCLSEITRSPRHHFHAPLVPVLFWAASAGLPNVAKLFSAARRCWARWRGRSRSTHPDPRGIPSEKFILSDRVLPVAGGPLGARGGLRWRQSPVNVAAAAALWAFLSSAFCSAPITFSPLGFGFWDVHSRAYWRGLYVPGERARRFPAAFALVPPESRVASTDYIHARFTHHERSYDYSPYRPSVPEDTEFIVIDVRHPHSRLDQIKELHEPEKWEVLDDHSGGYFIVLKRK